VSRGLAWLVAIAVLAPFIVMQMDRARSSEPLPVLYTLGGDFTLDSTLGRELSLSDFQGKLVLLNFGYTGCPDVCPTALSRMRDAMGMTSLEESRLQPLFVTLDPEVDSVDRIDPYVRFFDSRFIGLTGTAASVAAATEPFKVFYERVPSESGNGYSISHSSHIYLLDPAGRVRATFGEGVPVSDIASAIDSLARESELLAWSKAT
jgi:protein SCO1/2